MFLNTNVLLFILSCCFISNTLQIAAAINCYECDSFDDFTCTEIWDPELDVNLSFLSNCSHVSGPSYCIKMTGIYQVRNEIHRYRCIAIDTLFLPSPVQMIIIGRVIIFRVILVPNVFVHLKTWVIIASISRALETFKNTNHVYIHALQTNVIQLTWHKLIGRFFTVWS